MPSLQLSYCYSLPAMRVLLVFALGVAPFCVDAFATTSIACPRISSAFTNTLSRSIILTAKDNNSEETGTTYAPLSREEIQSLLDTVPLYAVTDANNQNDVVLLQERMGNDDTTNIDDQPSIQVANFFLTPETANNIYAPFRKQPGLELAQWDIVQYPLGVVWLELLHNPRPSEEETEEEVVYRLVPNEFELVSARNAVQKQQQQQCSFEADYNEIPVFYNPLLRVPEDTTQEKMAFFLGYQDFLDAQQLADAGSRGGVTVMALSDLVNQMMSPSSEMDFRKTLLIPPSTVSSYLPDRPSSNAEKSRQAFASTSTPDSGADQWTD